MHNASQAFTSHFTKEIEKYEKLAQMKCPLDVDTYALQKYQSLFIL